MIDLTYYYHSILLTLLNVHRSIATVEMHSLTAVDIHFTPTKAEGEKKKETKHSRNYFPYSHLIDLLIPTQHPSPHQLELKSSFNLKHPLARFFPVDDVPPRLGSGSN